MELRARTVDGLGVLDSVKMFCRRTGESEREGHHLDDAMSPDHMYVVYTPLTSRRVVRGGGRSSTLKSTLGGTDQHHKRKTNG